MAIISIGKASNDVLTGGPGNDVLQGNGGNDTIYGRAGNDRIEGGSGNDRLVGEAGNDTITGGTGNDTLDGGTGNDTMSGGTGNDVYSVDSLSDRVIEGADEGIDAVQSSIALTSAVANVENYTFTGAAAVHFTGNGLSNVISGTSAGDTIRGDDGGDAVYGKDGDDILNGDNGDDRLYGGIGNDTLSGDADNDTVDGGGGADKLSGGSGNDVMIVEDLGFAQVSGGTGEDTLRFVGAGFKIDLAQFAGTKVNDIERIDLSQSGPDDLTLSKAAVEAASTTSDRLIVDGKAGDVVHLDAAFVASGAQVVGGETYALYKSGSDTVLIDQAITVNPAAPLAEIVVSSLDGNDGFKITAPQHDEPDLAGRSAAALGDVNGDGFDDFAIGVPGRYGDSRHGSAYVVFGSSTGSGASLDLGGLAPAEGFRVDGGPDTNNSTGISVAGIGDFNGDGFADLIVGAHRDHQNALYSGAAFVVFGSGAGLPAAIDATALDGSNGFRIDGASFHSYAGYSVSGAGDLNGDGYDDLVVGALGETPNGKYSGATYVLFGHAGASAADITLTGLNGSDGFKIAGQAGDEAGTSVSRAGDVNGDGFDDLLVGAGGSSKTYVLFGHGGAFQALLDPATLDGSNGFVIDGRYNDRTGRAVASAGDVNGDGYDDILIGAASASPGGTAYVVFGHAGAFDAALDLAALDGTNGFAMVGHDGAGVDSSDSAGWSVSSAGDFNGDGYADLLVGAPDGGGFGQAAHGGAYVVYGAAGGFAATIQLDQLDGHAGLKLADTTSYDQAGFAVSAAGDINGDGYDDVIVGAPGARENGTVPGAAYVVYGGDFRTEGDHIGASGNDKLDGNALAELFAGGLGNDTLNGGGGADVLQGGGGNDQIHVTDHNFRLADGGGGTDTLHLDFAGAINLGNIDGNAATEDHGKITGIEIISIDNGQANALTLHVADVLDLKVQDHGVGGVAGLDNTLKIDGNSGDTLALAATDHWSAADTSSLVGYAVYTAGAVKIAVDTDIAVSTH